MTARTPYSRVSTTSDVIASPVDTVGDTPFSVVRSPKTTQGCRPTSVKIHPNELAKRGRKGSPIAAYRIVRPRGTRPPLVAMRIQPAMAAPAIPRPIIRRKDQYDSGTLGT